MHDPNQPQRIFWTGIGVQLVGGALIGLSGGAPAGLFFVFVAVTVAGVYATLIGAIAWAVQIAWGSRNQAQRPQASPLPSPTQTEAQPPTSAASASSASGTAEGREAQEHEIGQNASRSDVDDMVVLRWLRENPRVPPQRGADDLGISPMDMGHKLRWLRAQGYATGGAFTFYKITEAGNSLLDED